MDLQSVRDFLNLLLRMLWLDLFWMLDDGNGGCVDDSLLFRY